VIIKYDIKNLFKIDLHALKILTKGVVDFDIEYLIPSNKISRFIRIFLSKIKG